jgi:hypothetical protein
MLCSHQKESARENFETEKGAMTDRQASVALDFPSLPLLKLDQRERKTERHTEKESQSFSRADRHRDEGKERAKEKGDTNEVHPLHQILYAVIYWGTLGSVQRQLFAMIVIRSESSSSVGCNAQN